MMRASKCFVDWIAPALMLLSLLAWPSFAHAGSDRSEPSLARQLERLLRHDPEKERDTFLAEAMKLAAKGKEALEARKSERRKRNSDLENLSAAELRLHFQDDPNLLASREVRALEEIARLLQSDASTNASASIRELIEGLKNSRRSPVPERIGALSPWRMWLQNFDRSIGHGTEPAANLPMTGGNVALDANPLPSPFWNRPESIGSQNLAIGFGRSELPDYSSKIWNYAGPKTGAGTHPGFDVRSGKVRLKVKFGEAKSEPFTARIFHALGYNVDPTDFAGEIKVSYSRRILREFNLRHPLEMQLRPFWIPVTTLNLQPYQDPFAFVLKAVMKDGRELTGAELKSDLLIDPRRARPEDDPENFRIEVESQIAHLLFGPVNIQPEETVGENVGFWDFRGLGHENLRELRGAGLLAAWLGWFDSRYDNTRLRIVREEDGNSRLLFFFSDLGAGMGSGRGYLIRHGEDPEAMEDSFTEPEIRRGRGRMTTPFRITNYETIVPTEAFRRMTPDDARWMARMIAALKQEQIHSALIASGYDTSEAALYLEKLLIRRNKMFEDLGMEMVPADIARPSDSFPAKAAF